MPLLSSSFHVSKPFIPSQPLNIKFPSLTLLVAPSFILHRSKKVLPTVMGKQTRNPRHSLGKVSRVSSSEIWFQRESSHSAATKNSTTRSIMLPQVRFSSSSHSSNPGRMLLRTSRIRLMHNLHWELRRKKFIKHLLLSRSQ